MTGILTKPGEPGYFAVSPLLIFPRALGRFKVFIKQAGRFVLYASGGEVFTREHLTRLHENGVTEVYVQTAERDRFDRYLERNLSQYLLNEHVPPGNRAKVFHTAARAMVRDIYSRKFPARLVKRAQFQRIQAFVEKSLAFVAQGGSLKQLAELMAHDFKVYDHSLQVFVLTVALLNTYELPDGDMVQAGVGAILHDLGKLSIDPAILDKPGPLTAEERLLVQTHPARGVALCSEIALAPLALRVVLFHHERHDGSGYPAGAGGEEIPLAARAAGLVDVYAAMTSPRPYAKALSPFEALRTMREMKDAFEADMFKRFVMVLSGAEIV